MFYYNTDLFPTRDQYLIENENNIHDNNKDYLTMMDSSYVYKDFYEGQKNPHDFYILFRKIMLTAVFLAASILFIGMGLLSDEFVFHEISLGSESAAPSINHSPLQKQEQTSMLEVECAVSKRFPSAVLQWCSLITPYAEQFSMSPDVIASLIWQESGGDSKAYSRSGAVGLMQVMPSDGLAASFTCINGPCFKDRPTSEQLMDPEFNIKYGTRMLASLLNRHGDLREALKSYGPMNVGYYYADKVLSLYRRYGNKP